jgi:SAM-dependent methyltransferase
MSDFYGSDAQLHAYHARYVPWIDSAPRGAPVLDLGCGSGIFMELAAARGREVTGVEIEPGAAANARARGLTVVEDDALHFLETRRAAFSFIYCSHLIEHLPPASATRLLELARDALVPGGRLWLNTPNPASLEVMSEIFWLDLTHVRPYPLALLVQMVERAGLRVLVSGHDGTPGLPRRSLIRRLWLQLILGSHYGRENTYLMAEKAP